MKHSENCRFCDIIDGQYRYIGIDEPIASNDEFIAVPSIGALVEGWMLIIPKTHQHSMKNVYESTALTVIVESLFPSISRQYGPLIAFEHGANKEDSITGCGTDHAHLHLVPLDESLVPDLQNSGLLWVQCRVSEISSMSGENEYLFYAELNNTKFWQDPIGYLHVLERPISQFFRRAIANRRGKIEVADYMRFPHLYNAMRTRSALAVSVA